MQKSITLRPFFIRNRIKLLASDKEDFRPSDGSIMSIKGGFQRRYSLLPVGAPSLETTSTSSTDKANIFDMYSAGFASVALHEMNCIRRSVKICEPHNEHLLW